MTLLEDPSQWQNQTTNLPDAILVSAVQRPLRGRYPATTIFAAAITFSNGSNALRRTRNRRSRGGRASESFAAFTLPPTELSLKLNSLRGADAASRVDFR